MAYGLKASSCDPLGNNLELYKFVIKKKKKGGGNEKKGKKKETFDRWLSFYNISLFKFRKKC